MRQQIAWRRCEGGMSDIIKTWPGFMEPEKVLQVFTHPWPTFFFTLGPRRPSKPIERIFFTHRSRILGSFQVETIVQNVGQLPKLRSISDRGSEWQIRPDMWVAVCPPSFERLNECVYYASFRGWRYFCLETYRSQIDAKVPV